MVFGLVFRLRPKDPTLRLLPDETLRRGEPFALPEGPGKIKIIHKSKPGCHLFHRHPRFVPQKLLGLVHPEVHNT